MGLQSQESPTRRLVTPFTLLWKSAWLSPLTSPDMIPERKLSLPGITANVIEALVSAPGRVRIDRRKIDDVEFRPMKIGDQIAPATYELSD